MYALFPRYFLQWFPAFNLSVICVLIWVTSLFCLLFIHLSPDSRDVRILLSAFIALKLMAAVWQLPTLPRDPGSYAAALNRRHGKVVFSNFTPASVAAYTEAFSASLNTRGVEKLIARGPLVDEDFSLFCERNRTLLGGTRPDYFILFLLDGSVCGAQRKQLQIAGYPVVSEGECFVLYDLRSGSSPARP
jgi:hypothetical protein